MVRREKNQRLVKLGKTDWNAAEFREFLESEAVTSLSLIIKEIIKVVSGFFFSPRD